MSINSSYYSPDQVSDVNEELLTVQEELRDLYAWIDRIPLSRPKKHIARDFSDGVLLAEIIAHHFPTYVNLNNYFQASSKANKEVNWNHLNSSVLIRKFGIRLSKDTINELTNAHSGAIERVLFLVREKMGKMKPKILKPVKSRIPSKAVRSRSNLTLNTVAPPKKTTNIKKLQEIIQSNLHPVPSHSKTNETKSSTEDNTLETIKSLDKKGCTELDFINSIIDSVDLTADSCKPIMDITDKDFIIANDKSDTPNTIETLNTNVKQDTHMESNFDTLPKLRDIENPFKKIIDDTISEALLDIANEAKREVLVLDSSLNMEMEGDNQTRKSCKEILPAKVVDSLELEINRICNDSQFFCEHCSALIDSAEMSFDFASFSQPYNEVQCGCEYNECSLHHHQNLSEESYIPTTYGMNEEGMLLGRSFCPRFPDLTRSESITFGLV